MPDIILVKPQMGENIGAAARAMANFSITNLKLVAPRDGWPCERANANAVGALDDIVNVEVFDSVKEAIAPYNCVYATTARPRDMRKEVFTPSDAVTNIVKQQSDNQKTAILFGGERAGLDNDDIAIKQMGTLIEQAEKAYNDRKYPLAIDLFSLNIIQPLFQNLVLFIMSNAML